MSAIPFLQHPLHPDKNRTQPVKNRRGIATNACRYETRRHWDVKNADEHAQSASRQPNVDSGNGEIWYGLVQWPKVIPDNPVHPVNPVLFFRQDFQDLQDEGDFSPRGFRKVLWQML